MSREGMKAVKLAIKASAFHGLMDTFRPVGSPHKNHPDKICKRFIGMYIGLGAKAAHFHSCQQAVIFLFDNKKVPICDQQQKYHLIRQPEII